MRCEREKPVGVFFQQPLRLLALVLTACAGLGGVCAAWAHASAVNTGRCGTQVEHVLSGSNAARKHLFRTANKGNTGSQLCLASVYATLGRYRKAFHWYASAARANNPVAQFNLGVMYDRGLGVRRNVIQAARWYRSAARRGIPYAQYNLASLYEHGALNQDNISRAAHWYRSAAEQGLTRAQYQLGRMYHAGVGVRRDNEAAVKWLRGAAEHGLAPAQYDLAVLLDSGQGVMPDSARAVRWYRAAANQGYVEAQNTLGIKYETGNGVARDPRKAAHWFRLAAEKGNPSAQYNLGVMYAYGDGVRRNAVQGDVWLTLAQTSPLGHMHLRHGPGTLTRRIEPTMTLPQLKAALSRAAQWLATQRLAHRLSPQDSSSRPMGSVLLGE